ncbi:hypothetical protein [Paracoccus yeei]|uniref:Uncharacterized protein n=1 Tax=Paracoccus yeei TaxID=147645 RepID=A0A5P2QQW0_9RHOB|nr:hypothetical protein [Paracoccus yeei]MBY0134891.1 hypothetical protein [Paracoccus yeei]QEU08427.1 hypothetical protein FOB51_10690 [Paracoccus yeei]
MPRSGTPPKTRNACQWASNSISWVCREYRLAHSRESGKLLNANCPHVVAPQECHGAADTFGMAVERADPADRFAMPSTKSQ